MYNHKELPFENKLIHYLPHISRDKQWQYMPNIKTTKQLWDNFRQIVYNLNQDKLLKPLSDSEFNQLRKQLEEQTKTPYQAGKFLYGMNGKSQISIQRDDGKTVFLTLFDQDMIGAGNTTYQVVNQIERPRILAGHKDRRFDTTLLINGLPIIQIEEKADGHSAKEALNQMKQYIHERQYTGIFSTLQILVAMTPHDVEYMANTTEDQFNTDFAFHWKEDNGTTEYRDPILDWRQFTRDFLSIPMAHKMATNFIILDNSKHPSIKVMRPYQVYATERIINKLRQHDFGMGNQGLGYIWHTTGSGKTISSFKTAWLAARLPKVDKVIYLVDRVALTDQTTEDYQAYDPSTDRNNNHGLVLGVKNIFDLRNKLKRKQTSIIISSTQKMYKLIHDRKFRAPNQNLVFIVDEAHQGVGGMLKSIKKACPRSAWIGYTGTPKFHSDNNAPATKEIFGNPLHIYTISEAIADQNVLGFKVDFETTLSKQALRHDYLPKYFHHKYPKWNDVQIKHEIQNLSPKDMDDKVSSTVYDNNPKHIQLVVKDVLANWRKRSANYKYNALFTTHVGGNQSSIHMAMMYYREFRKQNHKMAKENANDTNYRPLQIAITFSQDTSDGNHQLATNEDLEKVMKEYNKRFHTSFDDTQVTDYMEDLTSRLNKTASDGKYLDLVIVVDQLLTGFDAPQLNTLYVDRTLHGAKLIQAYSRTNRIYNMQTKPFGNIVNYRWPAYSEDEMNKALSVYANPQSADVQTKFKFNRNDVLAESYQQIKHQLQATVSHLDNLTDDFKRVPASEHQQEQAYNELNRYNRQLAQIKQYDDYDDQHPQKLMHSIGMNGDQEARLTGAIADGLKKRVAKHHHVDISDLTMQMEHVKDVKVNYDYLHDLVAKLMNERHQPTHDEEIIENKLRHGLESKIDRMLNQLDDRKYAHQVQHFIQNTDKILDDAYPIKGRDIDNLIKNHSNNQIIQEINRFKRYWGLSEVREANQLSHLIALHQIGKQDLGRSNALENILRQGQRFYRQNKFTNATIKRLSSVKYHVELNQAIYKLADHIKRNY